MSNNWVSGETIPLRVNWSLVAKYQIKKTNRKLKEIYTNSITKDKLHYLLQTIPKALYKQTEPLQKGNPKTIWE